MTPEEFKEKVVNICERFDGDTELKHFELDYLFCDLLNILGYGEGVDIFKDQRKWYL